MTDRPDDLAKLADLQQMCHAPSDGFSAGAWCEAANEAVGIAFRLADALEAAQKERDDAQRGLALVLDGKVKTYSARVRQLEEALRISYPKTPIDSFLSDLDEITLLTSSMQTAASISSWVRERKRQLREELARELLAAKENTTP